MDNCPEELGKVNVSEYVIYCNKVTHAHEQPICLKNGVLNNLHLNAKATSQLRLQQSILGSIQISSQINRPFTIKLIV